MKIEISADVNVSAFVARQKANSFLILQIGDQLAAGEPELHIEKELSWRVPVFYAPSRQGMMGVVGHLLVNVNTGEVSLADGLTVDDLIDRAEALYERAAL
ncbi:MAG TPA: hypothetical protein PLD25_17745 [Chloroflexota bacterium]|nr:hypothetical protein [Chloroflexota bacterium]